MRDEPAIAVMIDSSSARIISITMILVMMPDAADHLAHCLGNTRAVDDWRRQHAFEPEHALEGERNEDEQQQAEKTGIEDRLERIGLGILELARVADGRFEAVGRPCGDEHAAEHERPARNVPRSGIRGIGVRRAAPAANSSTS